MQKMWARGLWIIRTSLEKSPQSMAGSSNTLGIWSSESRASGILSVLKREHSSWLSSVAVGGRFGALKLQRISVVEWARGKNEHLSHCSAGARTSGCQGATVETWRVGGSVGTMQRWAWRKCYHCKPGMTNFRETEAYGYLPISID